MGRSQKLRDRNVKHKGAKGFRVQGSQGPIKGLPRMGGLPLDPIPPLVQVVPNRDRNISPLSLLEVVSTVGYNEHCCGDDFSVVTVHKKLSSMLFESKGVCVRAVAPVSHIDLMELSEYFIPISCINAVTGLY